MHSQTLDNSNCRGPACDDLRLVILCNLAEHLELAGVADELLQMWDGHERALFEPVKKDFSPPAVQMDPVTRQANLALICGLSRASECPDECSFHAVQLFDATIWNMGAKGALLSHECASARSAAAWMICVKLTGASNVLHAKLPEICSIASQYSRWLGGGDVVPDDLLREEALALSLVKFNIRTTTPETWAIAFLARLDVATGCRVFAPNLTNLNALLTCWAGLVVSTLPLSAMHPPRFVALGIFSLALIAVKVLPVEAFTDAVEAHSFEEEAENTLHFTRENFLHESDALCPMVVPQKALLPAIEIATLFSAGGMLESAMRVHAVLREAGVGYA